MAEYSSENVAGNTDARLYFAQKQYAAYTFRMLRLHSTHVFTYETCLLSALLLFRIEFYIEMSVAVICAGS